jgi:hypothetical protein
MRPWTAPSIRLFGRQALAERTAITGGRVALVQPVVAEHLLAQRALGVFALGQTAFLQNWQEMVGEFAIGAGNRPIDQVHTIDACFLPAHKLIGDLFGRADEAGMALGDEATEIADRRLATRIALAQPVDMAAPAIGLDVPE